MKKSFIPNIFTFTNLSCGIILFLILLIGIIYFLVYLYYSRNVDRYDGRIARKLDVTSEIGKELDSLADLVSFVLLHHYLCL